MVDAVPLTDLIQRAQSATKPRCGRYSPRPTKTCIAWRAAASARAASGTCSTPPRWCTSPICVRRCGRAQARGSRPLLPLCRPGHAQRHRRHGARASGRTARRRRASRHAQHRDSANRRATARRKSCACTRRWRSWRARRALGAGGGDALFRRPDRDSRSPRRSASPIAPCGATGKRRGCCWRRRWAERIRGEAMSGSNGSRRFSRNVTSDEGTRHGQT